MARKRNKATQPETPAGEPLAMPQLGAWPADEVERIPIGELVAYGQNPMIHSDDQVALLVASMREFGFTIPILRDEKNEIIAGHGRLKAAQRLGLTHVPVITARGWPESRKRAYRIADNQLPRLAEFSSEMMKLELADLSLQGFNLELLGFNDTQLANWGAQIGPAGQSDPEHAPEPPKNPVTKPGDLWVLGENRLLCGDATSQSDVGRLLAGGKPNLMVTDPPYGVDYDPAWRDRLGIDWTGQTQRRSTHPASKPKASRSLGKVTNDDKADWRDAWALFPGSIAYVWHGGMRSGPVFLSLEHAGFAIRAQIIWVKQHFVFSQGDYHWQHEPCFYAVRGTGNWTGDRKQTTVWDIANASAFRGEKDDTVTGHGTQKPIECMRRPMENNSQRGDLVYEPFNGSGTTLIAGEMIGRKVMAMEIDPGYVDVAVERWQAYTGKKAVLEKSGRQDASDRELAS